jgi:hypothetical protein
MLIVSGVCAEWSNQFGLTGGTKGIGLKYSTFGKTFGVDIGVPIYYQYDKRTGDTVEMNHYLKIDPYIAFSAKVYETGRNEFAAGISLFPAIEYKYKNGNDTVGPRGGLVFSQAIGPCLQYMRKNKEMGKVFSVELFPASFFTNFQQSLNLSPNVQLNVYLR